MRKIMFKKIKTMLLIMILGIPFTHVYAKMPTPHYTKVTSHRAKKIPHVQKGTASWYGPGFQNKRTASGERYNMYKLTAAHKSIPLSTYVQVTNLKNGKHVIVKINDRGPFIPHRTIDLSYAAAKKIGMVYRGVAPVLIKVI